MNDSDLLFVVMVVVTVASPGPGVLMTLDNAIASGWRASMQGVIGLALGAAAMAGLSLAGAGLLVRSSPPLFVALKYGGCLYLAYLAWRAWRRPVAAPGRTSSVRAAGHRGLLIRGALLQTSNPKSVLLFMSVLPQVVESGEGTSWPVSRAIVAVGTYCVAVLLIHALYAAAAARARRWLMTPSASRRLARLSAFFYLGFVIAMLMPRP